MAGSVRLLPPELTKARTELSGHSSDGQAGSIGFRPACEVGEASEVREVRLFLPDVEATLALGQALAKSLPEGWPQPTALLRGGLGSGKTTLARGFVSVLPGSENAEVASPSFNLANVYPTCPAVVHMDLYRLGEGGFGADLEEFLEALPSNDHRVVLVEWAEYLPCACRPGDVLSIDWTEVPQGREVSLRPAGPLSQAWLEALCRNVLQSEHP